ncbi:DUF2339 domain-containing protein [Stieleria varia]|nr:hypothetical protein [Stieleria varia]
MFTDSSSPHAQAQRQATADIEAADRVLNRLEREGVMSTQAVAILRGNVAKLSGAPPSLRQSKFPSVDRVVADYLVDKHPQPATSQPASSQPASSQPETFQTETPPHAPPPVERTVEKAAFAAPPQSADRPDTPLATSPSQPSPFSVPLESSTEETVSTQVETVASPPTLSKAEIIRSFLAAHNVRWGELVAGLLIVICSVGLVLSLWNTIVTTHRAIPSLIFAAANTAIFAAALYTLSRWKLRHTSRAMLLIATLLVPLGILAGLASAGTDATAVSLDDPITIGSILVGGIVYMTLLWFGGRGLVGRRDALPMILSVAGPAMMLPLVPAAIRMDGRAPILLILVGSVSLLAALAWQLRISYREKCPTPGLSATRRRIVILSVGAFSLSALTANILYLWGVTTQNAIAVSIALIPAWVGVAEFALSIRNWNKRPRLAMAGTVISIIALGGVLAAMPAALISSSWLWTWAIVASVSLVIGAIGFRHRQWISVASVPVGVTTVLASQTFFATHAWDDLALWQRVIGGQPMVAAFVIGLVIAVVAWIVPKRWNRVVWNAIAAGFIALGAINVVVLSIAPASWLGVVPATAVTGLAVVAILAACAASVLVRKSSMEHHGAIADALAIAVIPLVMMGWCSVFHPISIGLPLASARVWLITSLAIAATLVTMTEGLRKFQSPTALLAWQSAVGFFSAIAVCFSLSMVRIDWTVSAWGLLAVTLLLGWIAFLNRSREWLMATQGTSLSLAALIGWGRFHETLFTSDAWRSSLALWGWGTLLAATLVAWLLLREVSRGVRRTKLRGTRFAWLDHRTVAPTRMLETVLGAGMLVFVILATAHGYLSMLLGVAAVDNTRFYAPVIVPLISFAAAALATGLFRRHIRSAVWSVGTLLGVVGIVWISNQIAQRTLVDAAEQLVLATSFATVGCIGLAAWLGGLRSKMSERDVVAAASMTTSPLLIAAGTGATLMTTSAGVLWVCDWLRPVLAAQLPNVFSAWTLAIWSGMGALVLGWFGQHSKNRNVLFLSAGLTFVATFLVMPLAVPNSIVAWAQWSTVALFGWIAVGALLSRDKPELRSAFQDVFHVAAATGILSAVCTTLGVWLSIDVVSLLGNSGGYVLTGITATALLTWPYLPWRKSEEHPIIARTLIWPLVLTLCSGHAALLLSTASSVTAILGAMSPQRLLIGLWMIATIASLARVLLQSLKFHSINHADFRHAAVMATGVTCTSLAHSATGFYGWVGLLACATAGWLVIPIAWAAKSKEPERTADSVAGRLLCWLMLIVGGYLAVRLSDHAGAGDWLEWTAMTGWISHWVILWRVACPDKPLTETTARAPLFSRILADNEFAVLLVLAWFGELVVSVGAASGPAFIGTLSERWLVLRLIVGALVVLTVIARNDRITAWFTSVALAVLTVTVFTARMAYVYEATYEETLAFATLVAPAVLAALAFSASMIARFTSAANLFWNRANAFTRSTSNNSNPQRRLGNTTIVADGISYVSWCVTCIATFLCVFWLAYDNTQRMLPMAIGSLAIIALVFTEISGQSRPDKQESRRMSAVGLGLLATFLWASVGVIGTEYPLLTLTMRWFVASVCTVAVFAFALPKMLGETMANVWSGAFEKARTAAAVLAAATLLALLGQEAMIRTQGDPTLISKPLVLGVAATLAILSVLTTAAAILSGPGTGYQKSWNLSDATRRFLVVAAQVFGGLTWFHLFLCKSPLADLGLRAYWPYIVMALAFGSVAITQWAKARGDDLMSDTLRQTSLYLPLVPVLGFWLSLSVFDVGNADEATQNAWSYVQGKVSYQSLLLIGTIYYGVVSFLWKNGFSRVATVILGNAALWILLTQTPGWGFLARPQAWLIPPAVCVLIVTHLYRKRLPAAAASSIRYVSTLVIYISSTADMLLNDIGSTLAGPIILVLLALAGMLAGVVLRVKPFLYLGAIFVFFGVTSMVWHAQTRIDAVWPWWAFGITTGMLLLAGLMAIEKNKPKLQRLATSLSTWEP